MQGLPRECLKQLPQAAGANLGAAGRNIGVVRAHTPYIAFSDDDSWWAPGALERAADLLDRDPRLALIAAKILVGEAQRLDPTCDFMAEALRRREHLDAVPIVGFIACGAIVRREAFLAAGGFERRFGVGGEVRNALWSAWLRRPFGAALRATGRTVRAALRDRHARAGLGDALRGARWVLGNRMPIPGDIEREVRRTEGFP